MRNFLIIILVLVASYSFCQLSDTLTLQDCYEYSWQNFSYDKFKSDNSEISDLKIKNLNTYWYPALNLYAQALYQSTAIEIDIPIPNVEMPGVPLDQYKGYLEVTQLIYDGGAVKSQKNIEEISLEADNLAVETQYILVKEQVNTLYFLNILLKKQQEVIELMLSTLESKKKLVESGVKNDVLLPVNLDIMQAQIYLAEQQLAEAEANWKTALKSLSLLTDKEIDEETILEFPEIEIDETDTVIKTPEINLLEVQKQGLTATENLVKSQRYPKISAFAQAGYGRPGLNMLSDEFNPYFIVGAQLSWNIYDWNKSKRERQILKVQNESIDLQKDNLVTTLDAELVNQLMIIEKLNEQLIKDQEIIDLRNKIMNSYESQLLNGVITSSEYITELNAVTEAKLNMEIHKIQLIQAKVNFMTIKGQL